MGEKERSSKMEEGPSVQKMSQELERLFAQSAVQPEVEEKKEIDSVEENLPPDHLLYSSPKRGIAMTPSPVLTPTRPEEQNQDPNNRNNNNNSNSSGSSSRSEEDNRSSFERCMQPALSKEAANAMARHVVRKLRKEAAGMQPSLNKEAANAMARHVVTKLRKEAAAMMATGERKKVSKASVPFHRSASPIARMRDSSFQTETRMSDNEQPRKETKSDREEKKERRKQWKKKAKIAQAKQRREKKALHDEYTIGTDSQFSTNNPIIGCVLDNVESTILFNRLAQCSGGIYNRETCAPVEFEECSYESSSSMDSDEDDTTEGDSTEDDTGGKRQQGSRKKKWENNSLDSSSVDTTVLEEQTASFLVSDDGSDHHDDGAVNRSRSELNQSLENISDFAFAGYSSAYSSRASTTSGSKTSRINHTSMNHHLLNAIDAPGFGKAFFRDMESNGESMLWHQETSSIDPTTVVMRLKKGYRLPSGKCCSPRLIWTDLRRKDNYGFEIFDIRSLDHASMVHLKDFPYAIPGRSVLMHLNNSTTLIFEAGTEADMMRFVCGMRWVLARLTHNLVTGNLEGSCELLDLGFKGDPKRNRSRRGTLLESDRSKAMDDLTEAMLDNALVSATFEV